MENLVGKEEIKTMFQLKAETLESLLIRDDFPKKVSKTKWNFNQVLNYWNNLVTESFNNEPTNKSGKEKIRTKSVIEESPNETKV